jgi:diaminohydroxyphosphoribosylaminopyrimidine deaminase/5-amino-6-(5-phosphoribosylamino)uracil reductase
MRAALALARRGLGRVWPNPAVGCILVRPDLGGRVVGRGWTQPGGRPHAETEALRCAGDTAKGATAYVTLEPCAHHGETGPCAEALVNAGIARCVVAVEDPDLRVAGRGIEILRAAGIAVAVGYRADEAAAVNAGFLSRVSTGRPWVALKTATTLDGMVASASGRSKWITGSEARARGHLLRARFDAILTGTGTVRADDPELTCRLPGMAEYSPLRVVMAGKEAIAEGYRVMPCRLYQDAAAAEVLADLAEAGVTRVLIEAGPRINASFLAADLVDEVHWFRAPKVMGGDGLAAFGDLRHYDPATLPGFILTARGMVGADTYEVWRRDRTGG